MAVPNSTCERHSRWIHGTHGNPDSNVEEYIGVSIVAAAATSFNIVVHLLLSRKNSSRSPCLRGQ